jgi:hypothetical protein
LKDTQVGFGITATATAQDNRVLQFGKAMNDAPGFELILITHEIFLVVGCLAKAV